MEALRDRYQQLIKSYSRLRYMCGKFEELRLKADEPLVADEVENEFITHRDALIKRFEFCYELTWKFLQLFLRTKYSIDANSPRKVFQECFQQSILSRDESVTFLEMIDARNATTHKYDESTADEVSKKIIEYYHFLESIIQRISIK